MKRLCPLLAMVILAVVKPVAADTIILRDGSSYAGDCRLQTIDFTDAQGIKYQFPVKDVQSLAFNASTDTGCEQLAGHSDRV